MVEVNRKRIPRAAISIIAQVVESGRKPISGLRTPKKLLDSLPTTEEVEQILGRNAITLQPGWADTVRGDIAEIVMSAQMASSFDYIERNAMPIRWCADRIREGKKPRPLNVADAKKLYLELRPKEQTPRDALLLETRARILRFLKRPERFKKIAFVDALKWVTEGKPPQTATQKAIAELLKRKKLNDLVLHRLTIRKNYRVATARFQRDRLSNTLQLPGSGPQTKPPNRPPLFKRIRGKPKR